MKYKLGDKVSWEGNICKGVGYVSSIDREECSLTFFPGQAIDIRSGKQQHGINLNKLDVTSGKLQPLPMTVDDVHEVAHAICSGSRFRWQGDYDALASDLNDVLVKHGAVVDIFLSVTVGTMLGKETAIVASETVSNKPCLASQLRWGVLGRSKRDEYNPLVWEKIENIMSGASCA